MGIYIKGMEMPTCCDDCFALDDHGDYPYCLISHDQRGYTFRTDISTMPSCPLIEVSTPHGRLIDADAMLNDLNKSVDDCIEWKNHAMEEENDEMVVRAEAAEMAFLEIAMRIKREYPTVIGAEEGE